MSDASLASAAPPAPSAFKSQLQIQFCVLLWGVTAILGKLISLSALSLVWWRMLMVTGALALLPRLWRELAALPRRLLGIYAGIGVLVTLHWLTFYGAVKLADASIAATCIALAPAFLSLIEPLIANRRFDARELILGLAVVPGVALVVGGVPADMRLGIGVGILSAALVAVFGALNKRYVHHADPMLVTGIELGSGTLMLTVLGLGLSALGLTEQLGTVWERPSLHDWAYLLTLALLCTLLPFTLFLVALRHVSTFSAQLAVNLEPVYAVLLAIPLLGEQRELGLSFYAGVIIILAAVFAQPALLWNRQRRKP